MVKMFFGVKGMTGFSDNKPYAVLSTYIQRNCISDE